MKKLASAVMLALSLGALQGAVWDIDFGFGGLLSGSQEVPPNASPAAGGEVGVGMLYDDVSNQLELNVAYGLFGWAPLLGTYTASHLHSAPAGVNGPVVVSLAPFHIPIGPNAGLYSAGVVLSAELESVLLAGGLYLNIHSTLFPGGEIRGQLVVDTSGGGTPVPDAGASALLMVLGLGAVGLGRRGFRRP